MLRKPYTRVPVDPPDPTTGLDHLHVPMVTVRVQKAGITSVRFLAVVDSGSPFCLFRMDLAKYLKIKLEDCKQVDVGGIVGTAAKAYFHKVKIFVENDWVFEVNAGFMDGLNVAGIVGRNGFFDHFLVHFDHSGKPPILQIDRIQKPH